MRHHLSELQALDRQNLERIESLEAENVRLREQLEARASGQETVSLPAPQLLPPPSPVAIASGDLATRNNGANDRFANIPPAVAEMIRTGARVKWPNNASLQEEQLSEQIAAWHKMDQYERYAYGNMPYREKDALVDAVRRKWPNDWSMQLFEFDQQYAAWQTLDNWRRVGIPGLTVTYTREIIDRAQSKRGNDYSTVVSEAQARAGERGR